MNAFEFENKMVRAVKNERMSTREVLEMINLAFERKHHLEQGYSSLFDYLTKAHGYSEGSAQRRILAAKLLRSNPEVSVKIEEGTLNLTTLSKAQGILQAQEKLSGKTIKPEQKELVLQTIENKSTDQVEKALFELFPDLSKEDHTERLTRVSPSTSKYTTYFDEETLNDLERAKELLSHIMPDGNFTEVIRYILKDFLKRKDPLRRVEKTAKRSKQTVTVTDTDTGADAGADADAGAGAETDAGADAGADSSAATPAKPRVTSKIRRSTIQKAHARCEYRNPKTGKTCGSRYQLQIDHIKPKAIGGTDAPENLRCLCRMHNLLMAERNLGKAFLQRRKGAT